jgi:hypothetical protein
VFFFYIGFFLTLYRMNYFVFISIYFQNCKKVKIVSMQARRFSVELALA